MLLLMRQRTLLHQILFSANQELGGLGARKLPGRIGEFGTLLSRGCTRPKGTVYTLVYLGKPEGNIFQTC